MIVIACDSFLALRNVRNGELGRRLAGYGVQAWVDPKQMASSLLARPEQVALDCLEDFNPVRDGTLRPLQKPAALARKAFYDGGTMWSLLKNQSARRHPQRAWRRAVSVGYAGGLVGRYWLAGRLGRAQVWRRRFAAALQKHPVAERYRVRLQEVGARVVAAFSPEGVREMALIEAANSLGIPTVVMIRSRDNLAAKIPHLPFASLYLVWAEVTRDFLLHMYPETRPGQVQVVGSPQFDRHLKADFRLTREEFFRQVGLDPARPLVVYTSATPGLIDHEVNITQHLAEAVRDGKLARGAQLLVRGHPRGFGSDYPLLKRVYAGVAVYPRPTAVPYRSPEHEAGVVGLILEDEGMHLATLAYQAVQVNVSGTMSVDSAVLDKPVVNVYYDIPVGVPAGLSVRHFYERSDMQTLLGYGGIRLAHSPSDCIDLINGYLADPSRDAAGRRRMAEAECGVLDGGAGARIAGVLAGMVRGA